MILISVPSTHPSTFGNPGGKVKYVMFINIVGVSDINFEIPMINNKII